MELISDWKASLELALEREPITVRDLRIGVFYTAAELSTGHTGVAFTPRELADTVCCPKSAAAAPHAGRLAGEQAWHLAAYAAAEAPLKRAVGVATLNALSALAASRSGFPGGRLCPDLDALDAAEIVGDDRVAMVGAFVPFIRRLRGNVADLWIVDKHREALKSDEAGFWRPPERAAEALSSASVAIISASALVEGGLEAMLHAASRARRVVLAGPTAPLWTEPFFSCGVDVLAGIRVLAPERMLRIVSEGGSGYFFKDASEKVSVVREKGSRNA
jgi:uncharacterized protein (DUF4213/DUF364 family)